MRVVPLPCGIRQHDRASVPSVEGGHRLLRGTPERVVLEVCDDVKPGAWGSVEAFSRWWRWDARGKVGGVDVPDGLCDCPSIGIKARVVDEAIVCDIGIIAIP